jgi:hypothetical protein
VVRLHDPLFAEAVRDAANVHYAMSIPALAAPAFAAALFGDRVQTLVTAAGRTLVVIELVIDSGETHLVGKSLRALMLDYRLLPVSLDGLLPSDITDESLKAGDRLTVIAQLPDIERLIRREIPPRTSSVMVDSVPQDRRGFLLGLVEVKRNCNAEEATKTIAAAPPITIAEGLTKGEAQALVEQLARNGVTGRCV